MCYLVHVGEALSKKDGLFSTDGSECWVSDAAAGLRGEGWACHKIVFSSSVADQVDENLRFVTIVLRLGNKTWWNAKGNPLPGIMS